MNLRKASETIRVNLRFMATKYKEKLIGLECSECHRINYYSSKNKKTIKEKLELKKYCKFCKQHTLHKETKVK